VSTRFASSRGLSWSVGRPRTYFVTTSQFAPAAKAYAGRIPQRLVLIGGDELTQLMVQYGVGDRTDHTIELRKLHLDYFEEDPVLNRDPGLGFHLRYRGNVPSRARGS
jgi:restriction endonuclease Mrr